MLYATTVNDSWPVIEIKSRPSVSVIIGNNFLQGRRVQYPIALKLSQTIHKVLGQTLPAVAIQMLPDEKFKLWEKEQFTVEISRCQKLSNIWIVEKREIFGIS